MSNRYLGGFITDTPTQPTPTSAPGIWTLSQVSQAIGNALWPSGQYQIANSLRFRSSASAYLNRTPGSAGNRQTWTWSGWVKRGSLGATQYVFSGALNSSNNFTGFQFNSSDQLDFITYTSGVDGRLITTQVFRDPSSWYHIVVVFDTTQATAANRMRLYVNGQQIAAFGTSTYPSQNYNGYVNNTYAHSISAFSGGSTFCDGYMADINFIDGQALTPSSFGETNVTTGVWQPKNYTGSYGTNGFKLNFSNGTSTTTLGYDSSGNSNNWTTNNISLTAGSTYDWMLDSPTPQAGSSYGVGNYCVMSPIDKYSSTNISDGNLTVNASSTSNNRATIGVSSGKWYWEIIAGSTGNPVGISTAQAVLSSYTGSDAYGWAYNNNGLKYNNGTGSAYGATFVNGDIIGVALNMDAGTITFYKNNVSQGQAFSSISGTVFPSCGGNSFTFNFGQRPFAYTPPSGYKSLCTYNLPTPTIQNGANYMAATTYTGTGATQTLSNAVNSVSFAPGLVWAKLRSGADNHRLADTVRGANKLLMSNLTDAESSLSTVITAFTSSGFTVGTDGSVNTSGQTYVGWQWKAGGTAVTNTAGSITSSVSANTTSGFAVVTYTGTGANATVGHGLGVAPSMIIVKNRSVVENWPVYHVSLTASGRILLNTTGAYAASSAQWNNTTPTSSVFTVNTDTGVNGSGNSLVAYCFAAIPGYSAFGSYTGNGSADGPFVYLGFRPRFVMIKGAVGVTSNWLLQDSARDLYNPEVYLLNPNTSDAEATASAYAVDFTANGFKIRNATTAWNYSGATFIYAAFAECPINLSLAR